MAWWCGDDGTSIRDCSLGRAAALNIGGCAAVLHSVHATKDRAKVRGMDQVVGPCALSARQWWHAQHGRVDAQKCATWPCARRSSKHTVHQAPPRNGPLPPLPPPPPPPPPPPRRVTRHPPASRHGGGGDATPLRIVRTRLSRGLGVCAALTMIMACISSSVGPGPSAPRACACVRHVRGCRAHAGRRVCRMGARRKHRGVAHVPHC